MDRAEQAGFGVAVVGHAALLAALTFGLATTIGAPPLSNPIEVSFVDEIDLVSAAPQPAAEPRAPAMAPAAGPVEDAAPVPAAEPAPPPPDPKPVAREPAASAARQPSRTPPREATGTAERTRRSRLGPDLLKGIGRDRSLSPSPAPAAAVMDAQAAAGIAEAIRRQVQPCADQQVYPGPGAERIVTTLNLKLNRNGSLAAPPRLIRQSGLDDENQRYAQRVADIAIAAFTGCSPLRGLPAELYAVPRGWSNFTMNYRLPG